MNWLRKDLLSFTANTKISDIWRHHWTVVKEHHKGCKSHRICFGSQAMFLPQNSIKNTAPTARGWTIQQVVAGRKVEATMWTHWTGVKKSGGNMSKKKKDKDKTYMSKGDSGFWDHCLHFQSETWMHGQPPHFIFQTIQRMATCPMLHFTWQMRNFPFMWNQNTTWTCCEEITTISSTNTLFCFDTGATSHISLFQIRFHQDLSNGAHGDLGVNGASILAIGIGIIKVRCGKGSNFTLNYTPYAPQATLHLISVGRLRDERMSDQLWSSTLPSAAIVQSPNSGSKKPEPWMDRTWVWSQVFSRWREGGGKPPPTQ